MASTAPSADLRKEYSAISEGLAKQIADLAVESCPQEYALSDSETLRSKTQEEMTKWLSDKKWSYQTCRGDRAFQGDKVDSLRKVSESGDLAVEMRVVDSIQHVNITVTSATAKDLGVQLPDDWGVNIGNEYDPLGEDQQDKWIEQGYEGKIE